ncbi:hypothetical protein A7P94_03810 [Eikenella sp. NML01-A-086]|nr:hypothetical protein A7P94_03810 [Eikenella sp. NML01-A-086]OAM42046.1 hypothetical protein A7Q02_05010 [Eikenella sp. NML97-A-109]
MACGDILKSARLPENDLGVKREKHFQHRENGYGLIWGKRYCLAIGLRRVSDGITGCLKRLHEEANSAQTLSHDFQVAFQAVILSCGGFDLGLL